jgi:hypothetical protein
VDIAAAPGPIRLAGTELFRQFQYLTVPLRFDTERLRCCALDVEDVIEKAATGGERNA